MVLAPSTVKLPLVQYSILNTGAGEHILEVHLLAVRTILNLTDDTVLYSYERYRYMYILYS